MKPISQAAAPLVANARRKNAEFERLKAERDRMHVALSEILEARDLEWAKSRALVALPEASE